MWIYCTIFSVNFHGIFFNKLVYFFAICNNNKKFMKSKLKKKHSQYRIEYITPIDIIFFPFSLGISTNLYWIWAIRSLQRHLWFSYFQQFYTNTLFRFLWGCLNTMPFLAWLRRYVHRLLSQLFVYITVSIHCFLEKFVKKSIRIAITCRYLFQIFFQENWCVNSFGIIG